MAPRRGCTRHRGTGVRTIQAKTKRSVSGMASHFRTGKTRQGRPGFAYQIAFVPVLDRFPRHEPLEVDEEILRLAALQLGRRSL